MFSKVTIAADDESVLLGVAAFQARAALSPLFSQLPNEKQVVSEGATSVLWFAHPAERFLLVTVWQPPPASPMHYAVKRSSQQPAVAGAEY
ncbi:hypothetical protein ACLK2E_16000 [Escherichia coli]